MSVFQRVGSLVRGWVGAGGRSTSCRSVDSDDFERDRRTEPRFRIDTSLSEKYRVTLLVDDERHDIYDLSTRGMCFKRGNVTAEVFDGDLINGRVDFRKVQIPVALEVVNQRASFVGCKVVDVPMLWLTEVARLVDPNRIASQFHEIAAPKPGDEDAAEAVAPPPEDGLTLRWFQGGPVCDLLAWYDDNGQLRKAQLFFLWEVVEWSQQHGLRTGRVERPPRAEGYRMPELSQLLSPPYEKAVRYATQIVDAAADLPSELKSLFASFA